MLFEFVNALGDTLTLADPSVGKYLLGLEGAGVADPRVQSTKLPLGDGERVIRAQLETRYMRAYMRFFPQDRATWFSQRREFAARLNPRLGVGTLRYQPEVSGEIYQIGAQYESGAGFGSVRTGAFEDATIAFRCPDPAWLWLPQQSTFISLAASGWVFPWVFPWVFYESAAPGGVQNDGDLDAYPVITFTAGGTGASDPVFTNQTTEKSYGFDLDMSPGDVLVVDIGQRTAFIGTMNVLNNRTDESEPWALIPGANSIELSLGSGAGTMQVDFGRRLAGI